MRYERVAQLGRGGMGVVDLGRGPDGTEVALKRLTFHGSADEIARARQRIEREAEVLTRLHHPNIVELLDVLEDGDELTLVMPYLTGGTLSDRVGRHGPAPAADVERLADALGSALAEAHRAGVVHRDLKPGNVLFDEAGTAHLADFGVASSRDDTAGLTAVGTVVGTPGFMSPEQARGEEARQSSDVFSLGATLLYAATGEGPYGRGAADLLMVRAAHGKVRPVPRHLPSGLRRRLQLMLDARPERRPSAAALVGGPAGTVVRRPVVGPVRRWPAWAAAGGLGVAALVAGVVVAARETGDGRDPTSTSTTEVACAELPYQPCGASGPAPGTDGRACLVGFEDYDEAPDNGCEAADDGLAEGASFPEGARPIKATIVPRDDVDTFAMAVGDGYHLLCDGRFTITLTAPAGMSLRLQVLDDDEVLDQTTSADGVPASLTLRETDCFVSEARTLTARISPIGTDRTGASYTVERSGSF
ncbi:MAG: serine/threonine-protein kinase [Acidimicrobiales bacterium]